MSALLEPVKSFVRATDSAVGRLARMGRSPAVLFDVHNTFGLDAQAPVIDFLARRGRVHIDAASTRLSRAELGERFAERNVGLEHIVPAEMAARRRYALVIITDSPSIKSWRRPPVAFLHHGSGFANLPSSYALEFLADRTAQYLFCLSDLEVQHYERLLGRSLSDRLVVTGQPKLDALVHGGYNRAAFLAGFGLDPARKTVLVSSHWREEGLFRSVDLRRLHDELAQLDVNVLVTGHNHLFNVSNHHFSSGVDWLARLKSIFTGSHMRVATRVVDNRPLLAAADFMICDHSSVHLEYATLYRPLIVFKRPDYTFSDPLALELLRETAAVVDRTDAMRRPIGDAMASGIVEPVARRRLLQYSFAWLGCSGRRTAEVVEMLARRG